MSMEYVRKYYGVPAKRGGRIAVIDLAGEETGTEGTILSATHNLRVRIDGRRNPQRYHPLSVKYLGT